MNLIMSTEVLKYTAPVSGGLGIGAGSVLLYRESVSIFDNLLLYIYSGGGGGLNTWL